MDELSEDPPSSPPALTPREVRARRRRRRRQLGTALFVLVAVGVFATAYFAVAGGGDGSSDEATATTAATTTTAVRPSGPYRVNTDVNVRVDPATSAKLVGTLEPGGVVFVLCVTEGQAVPGPTGATTQWLRTTGFGPVGYVTARYVEVGDDLRTQKIPACPAS